MLLFLGNPLAGPSKTQRLNPKVFDKAKSGVTFLKLLVLFSLLLPAFLIALQGNLHQFPELLGLVFPNELQNHCVAYLDHRTVRVEELDVRRHGVLVAHVERDLHGVVHDDVGLELVLEVERDDVVVAVRVLALKIDLLLVNSFAVGLGPRRHRGWRGWRSRRGCHLFEVLRRLCMVHRTF